MTGHGSLQRMQGGVPSSTGETSVIGAIGQVPERLRAALLDGREHWTSHDLGSERAMLLSRGRTTAWTGATSNGVMWSPQGRRGPVTEWQDAAQDAVAAGLMVSRDHVVLHTSSWGVQPVYVAQIGPDVLAFSSRSGPLLDLIDGPLDPDWDAWAAILSFNNPIDGRTPFAQIRRLRGAESRHLDLASGVVSIRRDVPRAIGLARSPAEPGEVVEAIRTALTSHSALSGVDRDPGSYRASLPITGGWDSRLIGAIAVEAFDPGDFYALTTSKHTDSTDPDVTFGALLAQHLGVTQEIIHPDGRDNPAYTRAAFETLEYETWEHSWFQPTASTLIARGLPVLDGFGGDALMKNALARDSLMAAEAPAEIGELLWRRLSRQPPDHLPAVSAQLLEDLSERCRAGIASARTGLGGMPNEARITLMLTRLVSGVSLGPFKMLAAGVEVVTPFIHPDASSALLSIPWQQKSNGALARRILEAARPGLSTLPSTNDHLSGTTRGRRRSNSAEARAWTVDRLARLDDFISYGFTGDDVEALHHKDSEPWRHRLIMLACWLETYESRLSDTRPPWWTR